MIVEIRKTDHRDPRDLLVDALHKLNMQSYHFVGEVGLCERKAEGNGNVSNFYKKKQTLYWREYKMVSLLT